MADELIFAEPFLSYQYSQLYIALLLSLSHTKQEYGNNIISHTAHIVDQ